MPRFCPLFSSSSGNSIFIGNGGTNILIDAGVSYTRLNKALCNIGVPIEHINGIFVTHEHSDHIAGLNTICKKHGTPLYMSEGTAQHFKNSVIYNNIHIIDGTVTIGEITVNRFSTSHDCADSSGYTATCGSYKFALCTDTGIVTDSIRSSLKGCNLVMIESNHDVNMLIKGPYPFLLKQRIRSEKGHLSNNDCAEELPSLVNSGTTRIILGHLSKHNNIPALAEKSANAKLLSGGFTRNQDYMLYVAPPEGGKVFSF